MDDMRQMQLATMEQMCNWMPLSDGLQGGTGCCLGTSMAPFAHSGAAVSRMRRLQWTNDYKILSVG
eukprot:6977745-Prymnesium_polylepis.1